MKRVLFDRARLEKGELQVNRIYAEEEKHKEEHLEDGRNIYFEGESIPFVAKLVKGKIVVEEKCMYFKIEDNKFVGFYEEKEKEGTFVDISVEDWQALLDKQSLGETIFYNSKSKKLDTILLGQFEELENGIATYKKDKEVEYNTNQLTYLRKRYTELKVAKADSEELGMDTSDIDTEISELKAKVISTQAKIKVLM